MIDMLNTTGSKIVAFLFGILMFAFGFSYVQQWFKIEGLFAAVILISIAVIAYFVLKRIDKKYGMTETLKNMEDLVDKATTNMTTTQLDWGFLRGFKGKAWDFQLKRKNRTIRLHVSEENGEPVGIDMTAESQASPIIKNKNPDYSPQLDDLLKARSDLLDAIEGVKRNPEEGSK